MVAYSVTYVSCVNGPTVAYFKDWKAAERFASLQSGTIDCIVIL